MGASSIGYNFGLSPAGNLLQVETGNTTRGTSIWPYNYNALVQPTITRPTIVGGVVQNNASVSGGANWTALQPTCTVTGDGTGATCTVVVDTVATFTVTSITITSGGTGYTTATVALSGGQDTALSLHSRGAQPIRLNMAVTQHTFTGSTGGVIFGNGVNATYPVARLDNLGCFWWSELVGETKYGKLCQTFTGANTYTFPDASGTNTWTIPALENANNWTTKQTFAAG